MKTHGTNFTQLKFIYSEKVTKFSKFSTVDLTGTTIYIGQIYRGDFTKFCDLLRIYELYDHLPSLILDSF